MVRRLFLQAIPRWMRQLPRIEQDWSACTQTLEGHADVVTSVAFSPDGKMVAQRLPMPGNRIVFDEEAILYLR
jgi:WD40 repeat protein